MMPPSFMEILNDSKMNITASKGRSFTLQHCWKLVEHMEKWKLRDEEAPPKKGGLASFG
jgi:hypothetical protein